MSNRLLTWLCEEGVYKSEELQAALKIAERSIDELPCCALLSQYLPGPRHSAYELCHADTPFPMGSGMVATTLQARCDHVLGLSISVAVQSTIAPYNHPLQSHCTRCHFHCGSLELLGV